MTLALLIDWTQGLHWLAGLDWIGWLAAGRYWMSVLFVITLPPALGWWFLVHPLARFWRRLGPRVTLTVVAVLYAGTAGALFPVRDALLIRDLGFQPLLAGLGVPFLVVGFLVARQRKKHLTTRILVGVPEMASDPAASELL
jgi:hypothetical protein